MVSPRDMIPMSCIEVRTQDLELIHFVSVKAICNMQRLNSVYSYQMGMRAIVILSSRGKNRCTRAMVLDEGLTKWLLPELHI